MSATPDTDADILGEIAAERAAQLMLHDPVADAMLPLHILPDKARDFLAIAHDRIVGRAGSDRRDLPRARRKLVQAAALIVAALETFPQENVT